MAAHPFLSPAWIDAARTIHEDFKERIFEPEEPVRMNVTVTDAPFDDAEVVGHVDTTTGSPVPREGLLDDPAVSVWVPYALARRMLVELEYEALLIAFMSGEIEVQGDVTLIMMLQDLEATPEQEALGNEIADRLRAITL